MHFSTENAGEAYTVGAEREAGAIGCDLASLLNPRDRILSGRGAARRQFDRRLLRRRIGTRQEKRQSKPRDLHRQ